MYVFFFNSVFHFYILPHKANFSPFFSPAISVFLSRTTLCREWWWLGTTKLFRAVRSFFPSPFPFDFCLIGSHSDRTTHPYTTHRDILFLLLLPWIFSLRAQIYEGNSILSLIAGNSPIFVAFSLPKWSFTLFFLLLYSFSFH